MTETERKNIYQRINQVMSEVQYIQKESKKVNNQYTFVSHDAVSCALHMPMVRAGIAMIPTISELIQDGNRTIAKMEIAFVNCDDPQDRIVVHYTGYGIDPSDKGIGKAISYAVKYALLKVFCLETGDDIERDNIQYQKDPIKVGKNPIQSPDEQLTEEEMMHRFFDDYEMEESTYEDFITYCKKCSNHYNLSVSETLFGFNKDYKRFLEAFENWRSNNAASNNAA